MMVASANATSFIVTFLAIGCSLVIAFNVFYIIYFRVWMRAAGDGVPLRLRDLFLLTLRRVPVHVVANAYIRARKAGLVVELKDIEDHLKQGGDVEAMIDSLIAGRMDSRTS